MTIPRGFPIGAALVAASAAVGCATAPPQPATPPPPPYARVAGTWEMIIAGPQGDRTMNVTIVQEGADLTVTMTGPAGRPVTGTGTVSGATIQWTVTRPVGEDDVVMPFIGTVSGDEMEGTVLLPRRELPWMATRAP